MDTTACLYLNLDFSYKFQNLFKQFSNKASTTAVYTQLLGRLLPIMFNIQHSTKSSVLPYDIIAQIIDNAGEKNDISLIKELALVSHSFHQICNKHIFATIELHTSSKKKFVKLLKRRPEVVKYIRKLTYRFQLMPVTRSRCDYDDKRYIPILPNFLRTISFLNCLTITASNILDWNTVDSSLTSALLHLMHLPTINHVDLFSIGNFPLFSLTSSVNLRRLDISDMSVEDDFFPETVVVSEMMPKIHEFHTTNSSLLTTKLLHAERQDGQPAFNFMDLRRLSIVNGDSEDDRNVRCLLQSAKLLEKLHLSAGDDGSLVGLHDILSPSARTLKELDLTIFLTYFPSPAGVCEELEAMAGHNVVEALSCEILADGGEETEDSIGSLIQKLEETLVKPGWSALRKVSFIVSIAVWREDAEEFFEALKSLPDKYLSHLSKLESIDFKYECNNDQNYDVS